jgi:ubiquinone/menaquinone biosynthesis C-methylase UbiE
MHIKRDIATYGELADWYDSHYQVNGTWPTSRSYAQALLQLLKEAGAIELQHKKLLDVACGGAFFLEYSQSEFAVACGCDLSYVALDEARRRCQVLRLCQANGEFLPYHDACFDVVTCLGSLEHFLHPEQALAEMRRVVKLDGILMILVPINPDWATYDIQPTEIVMGANEWRAMFAQHALHTVLSLATDESEALRASSGGCQVYCARPAVMPLQR